MRAIGIGDEVFGEEPLEALPHGLHANAEASGEGLGLRLTQALQLKQNGVARGLHPPPLANKARTYLLKYPRPVNSEFQGIGERCAAGLYSRQEVPSRRSIIM